MARKTTIAVKTLMDNAGLRSGADEAEGIIGGVGKKAGIAFAAATAAAGAFAASSVQAAVGFESAMGQVFTLLPGISGDAMAEMNAQVLEFSKTLGVVPDEVVPALYDALSAGVPRDNVFEFMEVAGKAAIGGNLEVADAVDLLSTAVNAYAEVGLTAAEASDLFFTTVRLGKTTVPELQASFAQVGPVAAALGVGLDEVGASLAVLTASGVPTAQAATQIRGAIAELGKSGTTAAKAFEELSGQTFQEFLDQGGSFADALQLMADSGVPVIEMFGSIEAAQAVMGLTANDGRALAAALAEMGDSAGATDAAFETMDATTGRSMGRLKAQFAALQIEIGNKLLPVLETVTDWVLANLPTWEAKFREVRDFIVNRALPPITTVINDVLVPALQSVVDYVVEHWPQIREVIRVVVEEVSALVEKHWPQIRQTILDAIAAVQAGIERAVAIIQYIWERWGEDISEFAREAWANIQQIIDGALDIIQGVFRAFKAIFEGDWEELWAAVKQILSGAKDVILGALGEMWARAKLAVRVAWDLIKTEVWNGIQALPGLFVRAHAMLLSAGVALFEKAKDGMLAAAGAAARAIGNWLAKLPGLLLEWGGDLYNAGLDLFGELKDGLIDALKDLPGELLDLVLGPLDEVIAKVEDIIGLIPGVGGGGGSKEGAEKDPDAASLAAAKKNFTGITPKSVTPVTQFHSGGTVMPNWTTGRVVGPNEALILAEVGEEVIPNGRSGGGAFIGTLIVNERRTLAEELEVAWLMHGSRNTN